MYVDGTLNAEGVLCDRNGVSRGWVTSEDGKVTGMGHGDCPVEPDVHGVIMTDVVNMHTHCADYGLRIPEGTTLEQAVSPPNGLKHRYLRESGRDVLQSNMRRFFEDSRSYGSATFVDFREGGAEGCRMLREVAPDAIILGRPTSEEFDPEEICEILSIADGIGLPSISDMDHRYIESIADAVRDRRMIFAIHASERIREDIDFILSLDPAFVVHMCEATDDDLLKCAEAEVPVVVCPTSNRFFGKTSPIHLAQVCGVDLAIGTDNGMLCKPDLLTEANVFAKMAEWQSGDPEESLRVPVRLSNKVLNAVESHRVALDSAPVTVMPCSDASGVPGPSEDRIHLER